ncbi:hypothetical protein [Paenibacillus durus]|uniref:Uncharacterized protein n=1 Tax=Paenibacillus durus TaxID=44251 RepID=A0A089HVG5_PAEDU|nr:hypothetical protein [Paenibacillus durus]AIQ15082.1 hypothetical protein PDUR_26825 [Paenibacillus durus]
MVSNIEWDDLNPIERYKIMQNRIPKFRIGTYQADIGEVILLTLYTIDLVLKQEGKTHYHFYILDDASVSHLIGVALGQISEPGILNRAFIAVDEAKLVYRFTVAKKFKIRDDRVKQLRINSWGREYIKEYKLLKTQQDIFGTLHSYFIKYFRTQQPVYANVCATLLLDINPHTAEQIQSLNDLLDIKLLS